MGDESALEAFLDEVLNTDLAAHYTFDSIRPFNIDDVPFPRRQGIAPSQLVSLMPMGGNVAPPPEVNQDSPDTDQQDAIPQSLPPNIAGPDPRIPRGYLADQLMLSDSAVAGVSPAILQGPIF